MRRRHPRHVGPRSPPHRGHRRLRGRAPDGHRPLRRSPRPRPEAPFRHPAHRGEPPLGARPVPRHPPPSAGPCPGRRGPRPRPPDRRRGRRNQPPDRRARSRPHPRDRPLQDGGRARAHAYPLQRGVARNRRLGHRHEPDVPGPRRGGPAPRLGGRDPAPQPGGAHRVGAWKPRHQPFLHRGQRRRPPDAARARGPGDRGDGPDDATGRRLQQDRDVFEGARGARQRGAVLRGPSVPHDRLDGGGRARRDPHRGARSARDHPRHGAHAGRAGSSPSSSRRRAPRAGTPPSTSPRTTS